MHATEPPDRPSAIDAWPALAAAADSDERDRALLLRDGRVFTGEVTPGKEFYRVHVTGGHVRIPAADVDAICNDLNDAYGLRRKRLPPNQGSSHLDLAKWCLQHRLYQQAELELAAATRLEPQLPELPVVRRRLEWAMKRPTPSSPTQVQSDVTAPIAVKAHEHSPATSNRTSPSPSNTDLELLVRGLSAGVTLDFKTYIQPMLVNRCATAACHGAMADNRPRLVRLDRHGQVPRRITLRNLEETLAYVDRAKSSESLLLKKATEPHGGLKAAPLDRNETAFRQLSHWVRRASGAPEQRPATVATHSAKPDEVTTTSVNLPLGRKPVRSPDSISRSASDSSRPTHGTRAAPSLPWVRELIDQESAQGSRAKDETSVEDDLVAEIEADLENDPYLIDPPSNADELLGPVEESGDFTPVDAFDPDIFNRQFSPDNERVAEPADADVETRSAVPAPPSAAS
ncbi:MAG: hypothetical protein K2Y37_14895 [Pirellulales bacterium]|nr:hypothetical protein [Pirellulales bacterium]